MALDSPRSLQQPVGRGGLQPHPEQPLHTLSCPGPVPPNQGLSGTLIRCLLGTSVLTHRIHLSLVPQEKHAHSFSLRVGVHVAHSPGACPVLLSSLSPQAVPTPCTRSLPVLARMWPLHPLRRGGLT